MKNLSKRILSSLPAIFFLLLCIVVVYVQLESLGFNLYEYLALDSPTLKDGANDAKPLIHALETYKHDNGQYPERIDALIYYHYLDLPTLSTINYDYEYDPFPSKDNRQEFMLFFKVRWSISSWYCYYSEDRQWLKSNFSCWSDPRPQKRSSE